MTSTGARPVVAEQGSRLAPLYEYFEIVSRGSTVRTEILAGFSTFLALSYIVVVNPAILAQAGIPAGAVFFATVATSAIGTLLMGAWARLPFALAPGMEMNAYVAFFAVGTVGLTWHQALGAVFWSGVVFLILSASGLRQRILHAIPDHMKTGLALSVGVFVALVGLRIAGVMRFEGTRVAGIGTLFSTDAAALALGLALVWTLSVLRVPGAALISVAVAAATIRTFGTTSESPFTVPSFREMSQAVGVLDLTILFNPRAWSVILILFLVDFYGSLAKLIGLTLRTSLARPEEGLPGLRQALIVDSAATTAGALIGTSNLTVYVESGVGIAAGGRTGLTAIVCGLCLLACFAVTPLLQFVPLVATSGVLVYVAIQLCPSLQQLRALHWFELLGLVAMQIAVVASFAIDRAFLIGILVYILHALVRRQSISPYLVVSAFILGLGWALQS